MQLDQVLQPFRFNALTSQGQLLFAEGNAEHFRAELSGRKARQPAPTTTDIQQIFARLQTQFSTQMTEFGLLGLLKGFAAGLEVGAGIGHVAVEPQLIKGIAQVVMVGNRLGVRVFVVEGTHGLVVVIFVEQRLAPLITDADHVADGTFEFQFSFDKRRA
ncbi:hypothetical protein D3C81_1582360 [compost metagenome]